MIGRLIALSLLVISGVIGYNNLSATDPAAGSSGPETWHYKITAPDESNTAQIDNLNDVIYLDFDSITPAYVQGNILILYYADKLECISLEESPVITPGFRSSRVSAAGQAQYGGGGNYYYYDYISNTAISGLGSDWAQTWVNDYNGGGPIGAIDPAYGNNLSGADKTALAQKIGIPAIDIARLGAIRLYASTYAGYRDPAGPFQTAPLRLGFRVQTIGPAAFAVLNSGPNSAPGYYWFYDQLDSFYISAVQILFSDRTAPFTIVTADPALNNYDCTNQPPLNIIIDAFDPVIPGEVNSGMAKILYNLDNQYWWITVTGTSAIIPVNTQGVHQLSYYAVDQAGNFGSRCDKYFTIDQTLPDFNGAGLISPVSTFNGATIISRTAVTFIQPIIDTYSGVQRVDIIVGNATGAIVANGALSELSGTPLTGTMSGTLNLPVTLPDGSYTITRTVVDKADNVSAPLVISVLIDKTPCIITSTPNLDIWYNVAPVTATFTAADNGSGLASGPTPQQAVRDTDGVTKVVCQAYDNAGNKSEKTFYIRIDSSKPAFSGPEIIFPSITDGSGRPVITQRTFTIIKPITDTYSGAEYVDLTVFNLSGTAVAAATLSLIDGSPLSGTIRGTVTLPNSLPDGEYTFSQVLYDRAGNASVPVTTVVVLAAATPPLEQQGFTIVPLDEYGNVINALRANTGDTVYVELQGNVPPGYYWGNVLVTAEGANIISIEESYDNWDNGMGLWWTEASSYIANGGKGSPYYYYHFHSLDNDTYRSDGSSWATAWEADSILYGQQGPAGSLFTTPDISEARFYYSGYLGNHSKERPGIRLGLKIKNPNIVRFYIDSNDLYEFNWKDFTASKDVTVSVTPRVNFQSVHTEGNNAWIQVSGPTDAKIGDTVTISTYGELMYDMGLYNASLVRTESDGVTSTLIAASNAKGNEWGPVSASYPITHASEEAIDATAQDVGHVPEGEPQGVRMIYSVNVNYQPIVYAPLDPPAPDGNNGWYKSHVVVNPYAIDVEDGVLETTPSVYFGVEGFNGQQKFSVTDSGRFTGVSLTGYGYSAPFNQDTENPSLESIVPNLTPGKNGWFKSVVIDFEADDLTSGIAGDTTTSITLDDGTRQFASWTVSDKAGNEATFRSEKYDIDHFPPHYLRTDIIDSDGPYNGWYHSLTVNLVAGDVLSGVDESSYSPANPQVATDNAAWAPSCAVSDNAGNQSTITSIAYQVDGTPPEVTHTFDQTPVNGWFNKKVTVTFNATDNVSGVDRYEPSKTHTFEEGKDQKFSCTVYDKAGNSATDKVQNINVDWTPPEFTKLPNDITVEQTSYEGAPASNAFLTGATAEDQPGLSGIKSVGPVNAPAIFPLGGPWPVIFRATDNAGNWVEETRYVTVQDTTPPVITAPKDIVVLATTKLKGVLGTPKTNPAIQAFLNAAKVIDICDSAPTLTNDAPNFFPVGQKVVTFNAVDRSGNKALPVTANVTVQKPPKPPPPGPPDGHGPPPATKIDITVRGTNEKTKEDPGAFIGVNDDDDNENGFPDRDEWKPLLDKKGKPIKDDDLVILDIKTVPPMKEFDSVILRILNGWPLRIWAVRKTGNIENWTVLSSQRHEEEIILEYPLPELYLEGMDVNDVSPIKKVEIEAEYQSNGQTDSDKVNVTVVKVVVHPIGTDFTAGKEGRILISSKQDRKYHTEVKTTKDDKVAQRNNGEVVITAYIFPTDLKDKVVYFRVFDPDPDDQSQYEKDNKGGDNADKTSKNGRLSRASVQATECTINNQQVLAAETILYITKQCSGDNYQVEVSFTKDFSQIIGKSMVFTAWKRVYLEYDKMYTKGATLPYGFPPDSDEDDPERLDDTIIVDNTDDFAIGDTVVFFDTNGLSVSREIKDKGVSTITVEDLDKSFSKYDGVKLENDNATHEVYFDYLEQAYGGNTDGSDGGTFVEFVRNFDGSGNIPKYTEFPPGDERDNFCGHWFKNQMALSNAFQIVAANKLYDNTKQATTNNNSNITCVYVGRFGFSGEEKIKALADTVVHEIGHQFELAPGMMGHVDLNVEWFNHQGGDDCIMSYDSDPFDEITEFDYSAKNKTPEDDCISFIRELADLR